MPAATSSCSSCNIPSNPRSPAPVAGPSRSEDTDLPAYNEEELAEQSGISPEEYEVLLVLDRCLDKTEERALESAAEHPDLRLHLIDGPGRGAEYSRRAGMEEACARLLSLGHPDGLIASTDVDTVVASD